MRLLASRRHESDRHRKLRHHRLPVHQKRPVTPVLLHHHYCWPPQPRGTCHGFQVTDGSLPVHRYQHHDFLDRRKPRHGRWQLGIALREQMRGCRRLVHPYRGFFRAHGSVKPRKAQEQNAEARPSRSLPRAYGSIALGQSPKPEVRHRFPCKLPKKLYPDPEGERIYPLRRRPL